MYKYGSGSQNETGRLYMDTLFHKLAEPWEKTDGCIHLLAELSQQKAMAKKVSALLPAVAETTHHRHYRQHLSLLETLLHRLPQASDSALVKADYLMLETLLHRLPQVAKCMGKRPFKRHLELFLEEIFYGAASDSALVKVNCLILLR